MKGHIIYYSGGGSTAKVAKAINRGMNEIMKCDITPVKKANPQSMVKYEVIGIGGPVWGGKETANLRKFAYSLPSLDGKLCFLYCTHGAMAVNYMFSLSWMLKKKGLKIIGYNDWYGSVYHCLHMPKPYLTDGHPDEIDITEAEEFGRQMAELALKINSGEAKIPEMPKGPDVDPLWRPRGIGTPRPPAAAENELLPQLKREIISEKCLYPECTICVDNCIVNAIDFSISPPVIKDTCNQCSFCDKLCPQEAILPNEEIMKMRSQYKINLDKCIYPECTICSDHCPMDAIGWDNVILDMKKIPRFSVEELGIDRNNNHSYDMNRG